MLAGKTTLLRHLLENSTLKIGCIVNDVANVNIDAKLIRNDRNKDRDKNKNTTTDLADTIELANGCACTQAPDFLLSRQPALLCCCLQCILLGKGRGILLPACVPMSVDDSEVRTKVTRVYYYWLSSLCCFRCCL